MTENDVVQFEQVLQWLYFKLNFGQLEHIHSNVLRRLPEFCLHQQLCALEGS